jgi:predicted DNA-binding transcriptional regulator AlpA
MGASGFNYEVLTSAELAGRLKVKESWVVDQSKRSRTFDPIPVFRLGKHRRYRWGSSEMNAWLDRRAGGNAQQQRKAGSSQKGGGM